MRTIRVDTSETTFVCVASPRARVADRETGEVKTNRDGVTLFQVGVCAMSGDGDQEDAATINVTVAGAPKGIRRGMPVTVTRLEAVPWEQGDRHGIAFRAAAITPAGSEAAAVVPEQKSRG
jgi:hypothetical protein